MEEIYVVVVEKYEKNNKSWSYNCILNNRVYSEDDANLEMIAAKNEDFRDRGCVSFYRYRKVLVKK